MARGTARRIAETAPPREAAGHSSIQHDGTLARRLCGTTTLWRNGGYCVGKHQLGCLIAPDQPQLSSCTAIAAPMAEQACIMFKRAGVLTLDHHVQ